jgi:predicted RNA binding protein YcfA (HicA-like mRNA interferase family)
VRVGRFVSMVDAQEVVKLLKRNGYETYVIKAE